MTRLDDLFAYEEQEAQRQRRTSNPAVAIPVIAILSFALTWVLGRFTIGTPLALVLGGSLALYALRYVLATIYAPKLPATLRDAPPRRAEAGSDEDGIRRASRRWEQRLDYAQDDARHLAHLIRPAFADLVNERLRLVHGVTWASDPQRVRALIGPQLWKFLTEPVPRRVTPQEIAILVAQMEAL
jgi:hypothetical protein